MSAHRYCLNDQVLGFPSSLFNADTCTRETAEKSCGWVSHSACPGTRNYNAIDVRGALANQPAALTVRAPQVLFVDRWNADNWANVSLASAPGGDHTQQLLEADLISLNPAAAPVDFQTAA
jgi:hypothetical protein